MPWSTDFGAHVWCLDYYRGIDGGCTDRYREKKHTPTRKHPGMLRSCHLPPEPWKKLAADCGLALRASQLLGEGGGSGSQGSDAGGGAAGSALIRGAAGGSAVGGAAASGQAGRPAVPAGPPLGQPSCAVCGRTPMQVRVWTGCP